MTEAEDCLKMQVIGLKMNQKMKVLFITQHFPPEKSANAFRISELAYNLNELDVKPIIFAPHPSFPTRTFERNWKILKLKNSGGIKLFNIWSWQSTSKDPGFVSRMFYYLIFPLHASILTIAYFNRFDLIITSNPPIFTAITGLFSKIILNKKWIIDSRDSWIDASIALGFLKEGSLPEKISRKFEKICYSRTDMILATTKELSKNIVNLYQTNKKIVLIPNGADTDFFYPCSIKKKNHILFLGNIGHAQDLKKYILAMKFIVKKHDIKLLIVGDGDTKENLEKFTLSHNLGNIVIFKGLIPRKNVPKVISESLIGIAPMKKLKTLNYMAPVKTYEYMACGVPFVASGIGEVVNLARESGGGIITDDTPEEIAKTINGLLDDHQKLIEMGKAGREYVKQHYDRKNIAFELKKCIEQLS
jgi:colanic acid biosynthesis glycosyl transferase WcaI